MSRLVLDTNFLISYLACSSLLSLSQKESSDSLVEPMDGGEDYRYGGEQYEEERRDDGAYRSQYSFFHGCKGNIKR